MSGHSKWSSIKHKKGAADIKKSKTFTKVIKEIIVAVKILGENPETNSRLRLAITKAKNVNMPKDNIEKAIKKGMGANLEDNYEELTYEGYAHGGVAIIVETLSNNRKRTAGEIRSIFTKNGGNLGEIGCVSYMFENKGLIIYLKDKYPFDELENLAIELGADDIKEYDDYIEILTLYEDFEDILNSLKEQKYEYESAELVKIANNNIKLNEKEYKKVLKIIDFLEDNDDVQNVYSNLEN